MTSLFARMGSAFVAAALLAAPASAAVFNIDITGRPGSGQTTWAFSGSGTAISSGLFGLGYSSVNGVHPASNFHDLGEFLLFTGGNLPSGQ